LAGLFVHMGGVNKNSAHLLLKNLVFNQEGEIR